MPTIQDAVGVTLTLGAESAFGTSPSGAGTSKAIRRTGHSLNLEKAPFASQEIRTDQQIYDVRHGGHIVRGQITGELSTQSYDDLIAAAVRQASWTAGTALTQSNFTSLAVTSSVVTLGSGNPSSLGLRIGDIVLFAGMSAAGNNTYFRITAMTTTTFTCTPLYGGSAMTDMSADTSCSVTVVGSKLLSGTASSSFTFEENHAELDMSRLFKGCRVGAMSVSLQPNANATISFDIMGQTMTVLTGASAPYFTSITAAPTTGLLTGIDGGVRMNATEQSVITALDFTINNNLAGGPVIGTALVPDIYQGIQMVTGNVSFYLQDQTLYNLFVNETEHDILAIANGLANATWIVFHFQRVKLNGATMQPAGDGGVIVQAQFQALLKSSGTGYDQTTLTIQRSN